MQKIVSGALLLIVIGLCGCGAGDPLGRRPVSGKVTLAGEPLAHGTIAFEPAGQGTSAGATIANGTYAIAADQGLPPGKYTVRISSPTGGVATPEAPGESTQLATEQIPADYNSNSTLKVEVLKEGNNAFDFFILNKAK